MNTLIKKVDEFNPSSNTETIDEAANILLQGGLVAFPTETVYGLGAYAFNPSAIKKIYLAKGRPSDNPVVVHVATEQQLMRVIKEKPSEIADKLMKSFWPGPLTFILKKNENIPYEATGGLETVAVRWPANKIAQLLIQKTGPIAAPSANTSGKPSPTKSAHVIHDLNGKVDMIIDGGSSDFGIDSTIIDLTSETPAILRPGSVTMEMIINCIGDVFLDKAMMDSYTEKPKAPGMKYVHYSPNASLTLVLGEQSNVIKTIKQLTETPQKKTAVLATNQTKDVYCSNALTILSLGDRDDKKQIAANLYDTLRQLDLLGIEQVYAEGYEENGIGFAIMNRLKKASGFNIINADTFS